MPGSVVLTGASSGIGRATALTIAHRADDLILHGLEPERDVADLLRAVRDTMRPGARLSYVAADFSDLGEVRGLVEAVRERTGTVGLLINNAARPGPAGRTLTADGHEGTFQTNYLAPVVLTGGLLDQIGDGTHGRIVNIASATHESATLRLDDLAFAQGAYSPSAVYAHAKLALVTYSCWLADHRPRESIDVVSMHPGVISTPLLHAMFSISGARPERAAAAIAHVASLRDDNGTYYDEQTPAAPNPQATDPVAQEALHEATRRLIGRY